MPATLRRRRRRPKTTRKRGGGGSARYTAIIIEPRKLKVLRRVLRNFLENLDSNWDIIVFHGTKNKEFVERIVAQDLPEFKNRIELKSLNRPNLDASGPNSYNGIMKSREILDQIPTEVFLVFQTDSVICSQHKDLLDKFLKCDYVGAPWGWMPGGNGGLSLRRKSKMLEVIDVCPITPENEDSVFSTGCHGRVSVRNPTKEEAKEFAIETMYSPKSWGIHKAWGHLPQHMEQFKQQCADFEAVRSEQGVLEG